MCYIQYTAVSYVSYGDLSVTNSIAVTIDTLVLKKKNLSFVYGS